MLVRYYDEEGKFIREEIVTSLPVENYQIRDSYYGGDLIYIVDSRQKSLAGLIDDNGKLFFPVSTHRITDGDKMYIEMRENLLKIQVEKSRKYFEARLLPLEKEKSKKSWWSKLWQ